MLDKGLCTVVGIEPQIKYLGMLAKYAGSNEVYIPEIVADGKPHTVYFTHNVGMTSLLRPDASHLAMFEQMASWGKVIARVSDKATSKLDDIPVCTPCDFLRMDVQGSEMMVLEWGGRTLKEAVAIMLEVSFITIYKNQPTLGAIDTKLRSMGFVPHKFMAGKSWSLIDKPDAKPDQLLEADIVYVRDFCHRAGMTQEQWKHLALLSEHVFNSPSLTARCLNMIDGG
jgi:hypothetical protein